MQEKEKKSQLIHPNVLNLKLPIPQWKRLRKIFPPHCLPHSVKANNCIGEGEKSRLNKFAAFNWFHLTLVSVEQQPRTHAPAWHYSLRAIAEGKAAGTECLLRKHCPSMKMDFSLLPQFFGSITHPLGRHNNHLSCFGSPDKLIGI